MQLGMLLTLRHLQEFPQCCITVNWTIVTVAPALHVLTFYMFRGLVASFVLCHVNHICLWWWWRRWLHI